MQTTPSSMASPLPLLLTLLFFSGGRATVSTPIHNACRATRFPAICEKTLTESPSLPANPSPSDLILATFNASSSGTATARSLSRSILSSSSDPNHTSTPATASISSPSPPTFSSASTSVSASDADFGSGSIPGYGSEPDVTVCKGGSCRFESVQAAVDSAPENQTGRFIIYIKEGVYEETVRVPFEKKNVVFVGDGMGKTVITGSLNAGMVGVSTYNTATVVSSLAAGSAAGGAAGVVLIPA